MHYPYPVINVPVDTLISVAVALRSLLSELGDNCDYEECGCASSRKIGHAERVLKELDAMIDLAEARQQMERYLQKYDMFVDKD